MGKGRGQRPFIYTRFLHKHFSYTSLLYSLPKCRNTNLAIVFVLTSLSNKAFLFCEDAKRGLALLKDAGMKKINFSGGEPFLVQGGSS